MAACPEVLVYPSHCKQLPVASTQTELAQFTVHNLHSEQYSIAVVLPHTYVHLFNMQYIQRFTPASYILGMVRMGLMVYDNTPCFSLSGMVCIPESCHRYRVISMTMYAKYTAGCTDSPLSLQPSSLCLLLVIPLQARICESL